MPGLRIQISGVVQGVGFRPFVYNLARKYHLLGYVLNDGDGVEMEVEGNRSNLDEFLKQLKISAPPSSRIEKINVRENPPKGFSDFKKKIA